MIELSFKFLTLLNPLGCMAQFVSLLRHFSPTRQRSIIVRESLIALLILLFTAFCGDRALSYLGIELTALKAGGGLILLLVALPMLFPPATSSSQHREDQISKPIEPYIVPLAIPLLAGPGIMTMILIESKKAPFAHVLGALAAVWSFCLAILLLSPHLGRHLGDRGLAVLDRFVGLVLIFISMNMILDGLKGHFHL